MTEGKFSISAPEYLTKTGSIDPVNIASVSKVNNSPSEKVALNTRGKASLEQPMNDLKMVYDEKFVDS